MKKEKLKWSEMTKRQRTVYIIDCIMKAIMLIMLGIIIVYGIVCNAKDRGKIAKADEHNIRTNFADEHNIGTNFADIEAYFYNSTISTHNDGNVIISFNVSKETQEVETPMGKRIINKKENTGTMEIMAVRRNSPFPDKRICADIVHFFNSVYTLTPNTFVSIKAANNYFEYNYDSFIMTANGLNFYGLSNNSLTNLYKKCETITEMCIGNRSGEFGRISIPTNLLAVREQPLEVYTYSFKKMNGNVSYKDFVGALYNGVYATQTGYVYQNFCCNGRYGICVDTTNNDIFVTGQYDIYLSDRSTKAKSYLEAIAPPPYNIVRGYNIKQQISTYLYITGSATSGEVLSLNQIMPTFNEGSYTEGYNKGYEDGYNSGKNNATGFNPVGMMIEPIAQLFNVKLFGDFSIGNFFTAALFVTLALAFMKMFAGG